MGAVFSTLFSAVSAHTDGCRCGQANVVCRKHQWMMLGMLGIFCAYIWMYGEYLFRRYCGPIALFLAKMKTKFCGEKHTHHDHDCHGNDCCHGHGHGCGHNCGHDHHSCGHDCTHGDENELLKDL